MFTRIIGLIFIVISLSFSMTNEKIDSYIEQNSLNYNLLTKEPIKVYASTPTLLYALYAIAPEKISGVNFEWNNYEKPYIKEDILKEPVVGGFFGQGKIPNVEMLLRLNPELILINANSKNMKKVEEIFGSIKKPMLYLNSTTLNDYIETLEILGKVLNKQERAKELIDYANSSLQLSQNLQNHMKNNNLKKVRMYYAQGKDGLSTECDGSRHVTLVPLSGGEVSHKCSDKGDYGRVKISFEEILKEKPDMILVYERELFDRIFDDPKWKLLDAVKNKKVYYIPREPFSWFDRPPSFMRFLGLRWLINLAYPDVFEIDIKKETKEFYKLFLDIDLTDEQIDKILVNKANIE